MELRMCEVMDKEIETWIVDNREWEERLYKRLETVEFLAVDLETTGFNPRTEKTLCIGLAWEEGKAVAIPMFHRDATFKPNIYRLGLILEQKKLIFHNPGFDMKFLAMIGIHVEAYFDTMIAHYVVDDERQGTHSLERCAAIVGYEKKGESLREFLPNKKVSFEEVPLSILMEYCAIDTGITYSLFEYYRNQVPPIFHFLLMPAINLYSNMELQGVKIDVDYISQLEKELIERGDVIHEQMKKWGLINFRSTAQLRKLLFDELKLPETWNRSTDKEALKFLSKHHELPKLMLEYRDVQTQLSDYVNKLPAERDENDYIHPDFLFHGTVTGRLSCRGINLMAISRDRNIQRMFIGGGDCLIMEADYSQIELKLAAILAGDQKLLQQFRDGKDIHNEFGMKLYKKKAEDITEYERVITKMVVFGVLYGRGAQSIADEFGIPVNEAQKYINMLFVEYPTLHKYVRKLESDVAIYKEIHTLQGRIRRFRGEITMKEQREAVNFPFQSLASDITLMATVMIGNFLRRCRMRSRVLWTIHDAILIEVAEPELAIVARAAKNMMAIAPSVFMPDVDLTFNCKINVGKNWGDVEKYKEEQIEQLSGQMKLWGFELEKEIFKLSDWRR